MITQEQIEEIKTRLVTAYNPLKIYIYGPYAWGKPDDEDAFKVLVIIEKSDEEPYKRGWKAFQVLMGLEVQRSVTVFTKEEFDKFSSDATSFSFEVKNKGKVLYATTTPSNFSKIIHV